MKRVIAGGWLLFALAAPALAENSPEDLLRRLTQTAAQGDARGFLSNLSNASQREFANLQTAKTEFSRAQQSFAAALDQRFGGGHQPVRIVGDQDLTSVLARLRDIELLSTRQLGPNKIQLRVRTLSKGFKGREVVEEDTFTAVREQGRWELELANLAQGARQITTGQTAAFNAVIQQVRAGTYKDDISAMIAAANARRNVLQGAHG
jgi:hypothetical protein